MSAICLGLLIAIGLEQTVELIHHHDQRDRLEATLHDESLLNRRIVRYDLDSVIEVRQNIHRNMANLDRNGAAFTPVPPTHDTFLPLIDTAWVTARSNATLSLLPDQFAQSYWRVEFLSDATAAAIFSIADTRKHVNSLVFLHASPADLTPDERSALLRAYSEEDQELGNLNYILMGFDFMNEAALAGRIPSIDDLAAESRRAQQTEAQPARP
jgi:hypothetical protein